MSLQHDGDLEILHAAITAVDRVTGRSVVTSIETRARAENQVLARQAAAHLLSTAGWTQETIGAKLRMSRDMAGHYIRRSHDQLVGPSTIEKIVLQECQKVFEEAMLES